MKVYKLTKPEDYKGLFKVSLVEDPAIQSNLMHFSEEKEFLFQDEEQRIIYAPALIPNKLIFRKDINGEPANVYFDAETIKSLHIDGMRNGYDGKVNLNHESNDTDGIFCFEQWIIEDSVNDKSVKLGFELPVGTLMKGYKIDNDSVWEDIKSGKLKGLSIEGQLFPEEQSTQLKKEDMNKKGAFALAIEKLKEIFESEDDKKEEVLPVEEVKEELAVEETPEEEVVVEEPKEEESDLQAELTAALTKIADLEAQIAAYESTKMANEEAEVKLKSDFEDLKLSSEAMETELMEFKKIPSIPNGEDEKETPLMKYRKKKEMLK